MRALRHRATCEWNPARRPNPARSLSLRGLLAVASEFHGPRPHRRRCRIRPARGSAKDCGRLRPAPRRSMRARHREPQKCSIWQTPVKRSCGVIVPIDCTPPQAQSGCGSFLSGVASVDFPWLVTGPEGRKEIAAIVRSRLALCRIIGGPEDRHGEQRRLAIVPVRRTLETQTRRFVPQPHGCGYFLPGLRPCASRRPL